MAVVHSYARFSTLKQSADYGGDSERRQLENGAEWVKKNGHTFSNLRLIDRGRSSFKGNRQKALAEFIRAIDRQLVKPGDILLVEAIDRLSRRGIRQTQDLVNSILNKGVHIAILTPVEKVYRADETNDIGGAIELAAFAYQAWVYSQNLSKRNKDINDYLRRKARTDGTKFKKAAPGWLEWNEETKGWTVKPGAKETITFVFTSVVSGLGEKRLIAELAKRKMKPLGKPGKKSGKTWNSTYLGKLLRDPAVVGTWQPMVLRDGKLVPEGDPVPNFYPRIISDELFYQAQASRGKRYQNRGPNGDFVNLFSGILHNARDGHPMHITTIQPRGKTYRRLVSYGHQKRLAGADPLSLNYPDFERAVLSFLKEVKVEDITPMTSNDYDSGITAKRAELVGVESRLAKLQVKLETEDENLDTLLAAVKNLEKKRTELKATLTELEQHSAVSESQPHAEAQSIMALLATTQDDELRDIRLRLRAVLGNLLDSIWVLPFKVERKGPRGARIAAHIQIVFKSGVWRSITMLHSLIDDTSVQITAKGNTLSLTSNGKPMFRLFLGHAGTWGKLTWAELHKVLTTDPTLGTLHFQSASKASGIWETTNNPDLDLRRYKSNTQMQKKFGV